MQLPFANSTFIRIVATFPTNFIIDSQTLREINRVLETGGQAVIVLNGTLKQMGLIGSLIEWAYAITGQRDEDSLDQSILDYFKGYGLVPELHIVPCEKSEVTVVTLTKPEDFHKLD